MTVSCLIKLSRCIHSINYVIKLHGILFPGCNLEVIKSLILFGYRRTSKSESNTNLKQSFIEKLIVILNSKLEAIRATRRRRHIFYKYITEHALLLRHLHPILLSVCSRTAFRPCEGVQFQDNHFSKQYSDVYIMSSVNLASAVDMLN